MSATSTIEWTQATWNPTTGCTRLSEGCRHCYAATMAARLKAMGTKRYAAGFELTLHEDLLDLPKHWAKPRTIFVNSMSDLFHQAVPLEFIQRVFDTMAACPQHQFQVLTKRSERLRALAAQLPWPDNVWMGVTVEEAKHQSRIDDLRQVPAAIRFLSCEPLLGPLEALNLNGVHWLIAGGESGPGARPIKAEWVRALRDQCQAAKVAFLFKQWGGVRKKAAGRTLDGCEHLEFPKPHQA